MPGKICGFQCPPSYIIVKQMHCGGDMILFPLRIMVKRHCPDAKIVPRQADMDLDTCNFFLVS